MSDGPLQFRDVSLEMRSIAGRKPVGVARVFVRGFAVCLILGSSSVVFSQAPSPDAATKQTTTKTKDSNTTLFNPKEPKTSDTPLPRTVLSTDTNWKRASWPPGRATKPPGYYHQPAGDLPDYPPTTWGSYSGDDGGKYSKFGSLEPGVYFDDITMMLRDNVEISAAVPSMHNYETIYVSTSDGHVIRTDDGGVTFEEIRVVISPFSTYGEAGQKMYYGSNAPMCGRAHLQRLRRLLCDLDGLPDRFSR